MSKGFITGTNEELIKAYKESRDESCTCFTASLTSLLFVINNLITSTQII